GPLDDELVGTRDPLRGRKLGARVHADRAPAEQSCGCAERLGGVDGTDDDEPRRRPVHLCEDTHPLVLEDAVTADLGRERRERGGCVTQRLVAFWEHEELCPWGRAL